MTGEGLRVGDTSDANPSEWGRHDSSVGITNLTSLAWFRWVGPHKKKKYDSSEI